MIAGIVLSVLGPAGICWGAMHAFNLRGTADKAVARRNAVRAVTAAHTMDLRLTRPSRFGPWFFRLVGALVMLGSPVLVLVGLALATGL
ncbi:hypothetical protein AB0C52_20555 [Streptomyces sp. NPDC048717]|uniref:hypothetical protein n=1 Tax=Streptomyces sp. NPDC048717 TaxID=3154928 RepID=UPI003429B185